MPRTKKPTADESKEMYVLPCCGDNPVKLASVAAPFCAAGMDHQQALAQAFLLIAQASIYLGEKNTPDILFTLNAVLRSFDLKRPATLRGYLLAIEPEQGPAIWGKALKGERVFSYELQKRLRAHRETLQNDRQAKAAAARQGKSRQ
jgi:hypothetical protein